jgi:DNA helicase HerA-like ATPase
MSQSTTYRLLPPPEGLTAYQERALRTTSFFGETHYTSSVYQSKSVFGIDRVNRGKHIYVVGKSGMGKSKLLEQLIRYDIANGEGIAVFDPHGDLIKDVLSFLPEHRIADTWYIQPTSPDFSFYCNPFAQKDLTRKQLVADGIVETFRKQFAGTWNPRMEHLFRFCCLAMIEHPRGTLALLFRLLNDSQARSEILEGVQDPYVKRFFGVEFISFSQRYDHEAITPLVNRLGQFLADEQLRRIFSAEENLLDFTEAMEKRKIVLIDLSRRALGQENADLFGSLLLTILTQTALARSQQASEQRKSFYVYVDEFHAFATQSFLHLFSEGRKYGICLTVAHQYLAQLSQAVQEAVLGNAGTLIAFRTGGADAERLAKEFTPHVRPEDLVNLPVRGCYVTLSVRGQTSLPFSALILPLEKGSFIDRAERILQGMHQQAKRMNVGLAKKEIPTIAPKVEELPPV